jgi:TolA-binding protein
MSNPEDEIESGVDASTKEASLQNGSDRPVALAQSRATSGSESQKAAQPIPTKLPPYLAKSSTVNPAKADGAVAAPPQQDVQTSEQRLYSKVLESYRRHSVAETTKSVQLLLKTYPDSVYADNALYLAGLLSFEKGDLARAAEFMERVLREYPRGNKVVSALFAKAMIQKNQGRWLDARNILRGVRQHYPGSPEAARAVLELKFIDISANKKREG